MPHGIIATATTQLRQLTRTLRALFYEELFKGPQINAAIAMQMMMEVDSDSDSEDYNWLGQIPAMEEWIDSRPHASLRQFGQTIRNANYANGIEVPMDWVEDDKLGQAKARIPGLIDGYWHHIFNRFLNLLETGETALCYDGLAFFSAAHTEGDSGTQSNYDASGVTLSAANYEVVKARMIELKDDRGQNMGIRPTHLWTSPAQETTAKEIVTVSRLASGADNPNAGDVDIIVIPGLTTTTWWGLADLSKRSKPFIKQNRRRMSFTAMDKIDDEMVYDKRQARYGADYRGGYGYGFWQTMHMSTGA
jgi:phage major head subunit gpT-like protein